MEGGGRVMGGNRDNCNSTIKEFEKIIMMKDEVFGHSTPVAGESHLKSAFELEADMRCRYRKTNSNLKAKFGKPD